MPFTWNLNRIFRRRLNEPERPGRIHVYIPEEEKRILKAITVPLEIEPRSGPGMLKSLKDSRGKTVVVPIWKTELARGSQN
jgi:hypothetical protein